MKLTASCLIVLACCQVCCGKLWGKEAKGPGVRQLFACQIYSARPGVKVIESAMDYAAAREELTEIVFPEGVRRADAKKLRELADGDVDFARERVVLIWNATMADEVRVVAVDADTIRVQNVTTELNALQGSAHCIVLAVPRGEAVPRITWVGKAPQAAARKN